MARLHESTRGPTAFVFAGGGSLGAVEVGMLRALVEIGQRPDLVLGASVGAINGFYFAAAPDARGVERLAQVWLGIRRADVFPVGPARGLLALLGGGRSLVSPHGLRRLLIENLPGSTLESTATPMYVVATDLRSGSEVILSRGSAVEALLASAAIPAVFPSVSIDGRPLVDGGIAANTPVAAAVALGARRVIVLPTGFSCAAGPRSNRALAVALHALNLLIARQLVTDLTRAPADVEIRVVPPLCPMPCSAYDFTHTAELIERAESSTRSWLAAGGLEVPGIPVELEPHVHE
ncbi:MAG: patatin-like phospholipase family protein [Myxococcota bacterium]